MVPLVFKYIFEALNLIFVYRFYSVCRMNYRRRKFRIATRNQSAHTFTFELITLILYEERVDWTNRSIRSTPLNTPFDVLCWRAYCALVNAWKELFKMLSFSTSQLPPR